MDADQRPASTATRDHEKETSIHGLNNSEANMPVADLEISVLLCVAEIPKLIFSLELELQFLQVYHEVTSSSQGQELFFRTREECEIVHAYGPVTP